MAHDDGLGVGRVGELEVVGEDVSGMNFGFSVGDNFASRFGDLLWFSPVRRIQRVFFRTPLVYVFVFGSHLYHDRIWWPLVGRQRMAGLRRRSRWARFFDEYPQSPESRGPGAGPRGEL
jgi:hypothetical protein